MKTTINLPAPELPLSESVTKASGMLSDIRAGNDFAYCEVFQVTHMGAALCFLTEAVDAYAAQNTSVARVALSLADANMNRSKNPAGMGNHSQSAADVQEVVEAFRTTALHLNQSVSLLLTAPNPTPELLDTVRAGLGYAAKSAIDTTIGLVVAHKIIPPRP